MSPRAESDHDPSSRPRRIVELLLFRVVPAGLLLGTGLTIALALAAGIPGLALGLAATALLAGAYGRRAERSTPFAVACALIALTMAGFGIAVVAAIDVAVVCHDRVC